MRRSLIILNTFALSTTMVYAGLLIVNGLRARQPWAVTCYNCKACTAKCILGIDPQGFVAAALAGNRDIYVYATNIRLQARQAKAMDPDMVVSVGEHRLRASEAVERLGPEAEVVTYRVRAGDAARLCLDCGACERGCVLGLPLMRMIDQLRKDQEVHSHAS
jgi:heterodisulfide reductase subunit C